MGMKRVSAVAWDASSFARTLRRTKMADKQGGELGVDGKWALAEKGVKRHVGGVILKV
jgi:hypothetical protein